MRSLAITILAFWLFSSGLSGQNQSVSTLLSSAIYTEEVSGDLDKAMRLYLDIVKKYPDERPAVARALYHLAKAFTCP